MSLLGILVVLLVISLLEAKFLVSSSLPVTANLQLHLDASDTSSFVVDSGLLGNNARIKRWKDLSPANRMVSNHDVNSQPRYRPRDALNGLPSLFNRDGEGFLRFDGSFLDSTSYTAFFVYQFQDATEKHQILMGAETPAGVPYNGCPSQECFAFGKIKDFNVGPSGLKNSSQPYRWIHGTKDDELRSDVDPWLYDSQSRIEIDTFRYNHNTQRRDVFSSFAPVSNGTHLRYLRATDVSVFVGAATVNNVTLGRGKGSKGFRGYFQEVLLYDRPLSLGEQRRVQHYLMEKWDRLPNRGHHCAPKCNPDSCPGELCEDGDCDASFNPGYCFGQNKGIQRCPVGIETCGYHIRHGGQGTDFHCGRMLNSSCQTTRRALPKRLFPVRYTASKCASMSDTCLFPSSSCAANATCFNVTAGVPSAGCCCAQNFTGDGRSYCRHCSNPSGICPVIWLRADAAVVDFENRTIALRDEGLWGYDMQQRSPTKRPQYIAAHAGFSGQPAIRFDKYSFMEMADRNVPEFRHTMTGVVLAYISDEDSALRALNYVFSVGSLKDTQDLTGGWHFAIGRSVHLLQVGSDLPLRVSYSAVGYEEDLKPHIVSWRLNFDTNHVQLRVDGGSWVNRQVLSKPQIAEHMYEGQADFGSHPERPCSLGSGAGAFTFGEMRLYEQFLSDEDIDHVELEILSRLAPDMVVHSGCAPGVCGTGPNAGSCVPTIKGHRCECLGSASINEEFRSNGCNPGPKYKFRADFESLGIDDENRVETWRNQGNPTFSNFTVTQNDTAYRPLLVANSLNGHSVLKFDGDYLEISDQNVSLDLGKLPQTSGATYFVVAALRTFNSNLGIVFQQGFYADFSLGMFLMYGSSVSDAPNRDGYDVAIPDIADGSPTRVVFDFEFAVYTVRFEYNKTQQLQRNGGGWETKAWLGQGLTPQAMCDASQVSQHGKCTRCVPQLNPFNCPTYLAGQSGYDTTANAFRIGAQSKSLARFASMELAEMRFYDEYLSDQELADVEHDLAVRYHISALDFVAPVITCPSNMTGFADLELRTRVFTFDVVVEDAFEGTLQAVADPVGAPDSGYPFSTGTTKLGFKGEDKNGNIAKCTFWVTVTPPRLDGVLLSDDGAAAIALCEASPVQCTVANAPAAGGVNISVLVSDVNAAQTPRVSVFVGGRECVNASASFSLSSNKTVVTCVLPPGVATQALQLRIGSYSLDFFDAVTYRAPTLQRVTSGECVSDGRDIHSCSFLESSRVVVYGDDFGPGKPFVLIGSEICQDVTDTYSTVYELNGVNRTGDAVNCTIAPGFDKNQGVVLFQENGGVDTGGPLVSYYQCPAGTFLQDSKCIPCPAGLVSSGAGNVACTLCAEELISDATRRKCLPCQTSAIPDPGQRDTCQCKPGFYAVLNVSYEALEDAGIEWDVDIASVINASIGFSCHACPRGANCTSAGVTFYSMGLLRGYWQDKSYYYENPEMQPFYETKTCLSHAACPAQRFSAEGLPLNGDVQGSAVLACSQGHTGPLCAACEPGFYLDNTMRCATCESDAGFSWVGLVIIILVIVLVIVLIWKIRPYVSSYIHSQSYTQLSAKLKTMISTYQVVATLDQSFTIPWPQDFLDFVQALHQITMGWLPVTNFHCAGGNFYSYFWFMQLVPLIPMCMLVVMYCVLEYRRSRGLHVYGGHLAMIQFFNRSAQDKKREHINIPCITGTARPGTRRYEIMHGPPLSAPPDPPLPGVIVHDNEEEKEEEEKLTTKDATNKSQLRVLDAGDDGPQPQNPPVLWRPVTMAADPVTRSQQIEDDTDAVSELSTDPYWLIFLLWCFLVYLPVSSASLRLFQCDHLTSGESFLVSDYSIRCDSEEHGWYYVWASVSIVVYTIGVPALFLYQMLSFGSKNLFVLETKSYRKLKKEFKRTRSQFVWAGLCGDRRRHTHNVCTRAWRGLKNACQYIGEKCCNRGPRQQQDRSISAVSQRSNETDTDSRFYEANIVLRHNEIPNPAIAYRMAFFFSSYERKYWYFEIWELFRKLFMTSLVIFTTTGPIATTSVAIFFSLSCLSLYQTLKPFRDDDDDMVNAIAQLQIIVMLMLGILLQVRETFVNQLAGDLSQSSDLEDFADSENVIGAVLVVLNITLPLVVIFALINQHYEESLWKEVEDDYDDVSLKQAKADDSGKVGMPTFLTSFREDEDSSAASDDDNNHKSALLRDAGDEKTITEIANETN